VSTDENFEIKLITDSEHHFNDLCFKIRVLASTWLLATFGGIGFIATKEINIGVPVTGLITILCFASSIGITVLWILDLLIYQQLCNCWFQCRNELEHKSKLSKLVYEKISETQPKKRATNRIKIYYHATASAPILFSVIVNLHKAIQAELDAIIFTLDAFILVIIINFIIYTKSPGESPNNTNSADAKSGAADL
jgi:hypothetical protein